jgi:hypothetical protein
LLKRKGGRTMCEANVYLNTDEGKEELLMEGVNILRPAKGCKGSYQRDVPVGPSDYIGNGLRFRRCQWTVISYLNSTET